VPQPRILQPGDEAALDAFLAGHAESSMFLRSNARAAGLLDRGAPLQATYLAAIEEGAIVAVVAHCWNGMVLLQAPAHVEALTREAVRRSGRAVSGLSGPWRQVLAAREALGLGATPALKDSREDLYRLDLVDLIFPPALATGELRCRHSEASELDLLVDWRVSFASEALGATAGPALRSASREAVLLHHARGSDWVLVAGEKPVAYAVFNATLPDIVQIGGVWTPPALRNRGFGRAVVAGALLAAREQNALRAVLFADPANGAARGAYLALGFRIVGDYGLVLFQEPHALAGVPIPA
jgi:RimJ/RimL family protein N-acetyltransferase